MGRKVGVLLAIAMAVMLLPAGSAHARCYKPAGTRVAESNRNGVVYTHHGRKDRDGVDAIHFWGCLYRYGRTIQLRTAYGRFTSYGPGEFLIGGVIRDSERVRQIGRWSVILHDWRIIEGCDTSTTDPSVFRANLLTGRVKQLRGGVTCDGEDF